MKKYYIYLILLSITTQILPSSDNNFAQQQAEEFAKVIARIEKMTEVYRMPPATHFHVNINQNQTNDQTSTQESLHTQETTNTQEPYNYPAAFKQLYDHQIEQCQSFLSSACNYIQNHKIMCAVIATTTIYSYMLYQIFLKQQHIKSLVWVEWKNQYNLEELMIQSSTQMKSELLKHIQQLYADPQDPTNFIYSLVKFSKCLQEEIDVIQEMLKIYSWLQTIRCTKLFYIQDDMITQTQAQLHKLLFIKHLFASWYADYKIEKNSLC